MRTLSILSVALFALAACGGGGTSTDMGSTTDSGGGADMPATAPTCAAYCTAITANCADANRQFGDAADEAMANCMSACANFGWATGTLADTSGNTLGCHLYHAGASAGAPATHCVHAGPLGGGMCGASACADFCAADLAVCTGANAAYTSMADCMTKCGAYSDATMTIASPTATSGNTLACRTYHLTAAASGVAADATLHCPHTGMASVGVCM